jgi:diguanylate cyclase (GGDEF)-like protein
MAGLVLVAEDSLVIRTLLREQLLADGYEIVEATDGQQALDMLRATPPDVVLLDIEMPEIGGFQVLSELKNDPKLSDIPVVFLTARDRTEDLVRALELGAHDYLRKPFESSELTARVRAAMRVKALQDELRVRNAELETMSRTDSLTGLWNRRHLEEHLDEVAASAERRHDPFAILMIDIDWFKRVNDEGGHATGDAVLREVATRLRSGIRTEDQIARWGGEEFLAVLPVTWADEAQIIAERLRQSIEGEPILVDGRFLEVTVSIGVAAGVTDPDALVDAADRAMYRAKESGRNQVVMDAA